MTLQKGDKAPDFNLVSTDMKQVSLADFSGRKLIMHFFPFAFTSVCTEQLCTMRDNLDFYTGLGADVVGISVDSPFSLKQFKQEQGYQFPLLSDFNKEASEAYGALYESFGPGLKGVSRRAAFVIDEQGKIAYAEVLESAGDLPDFNAIKESLQS